MTDDEKPPREPYSKTFLIEVAEDTPEMRAKLARRAVWSVQQAGLMLRGEFPWLDRSVILAALDAGEIEGGPFHWQHYLDEPPIGPPSNPVTLQSFFVKAKSIRKWCQSHAIQEEQAAREVKALARKVKAGRPAAKQAAQQRDMRLYQAHTRGTTFDELAREYGMDAYDVRLACDRARKRIARRKS